MYVSLVVTVAWRLACLLCGESNAREIGEVCRVRARMGCMRVVCWLCTAWLRGVVSVMRA